MGSKKLRFKKLLNEYRYLIKEQEFVQEIMKEANRDFDYEYRDFCDRNELDYEELTGRKAPEDEEAQGDQIIEQGKEEEVEEEPERIEVPFHIKQLYKSIARKLHPDSLAASDPEYDEKVKDFKEAGRAVDTGHWGALLDIADRRNVKIIHYAQIAKAIKEDITRIEAEVKDKQQTFAWHVYECDEDEDCIERLMKTYLQMTKGIQIQETKK